jgi:hypothetical protein
MCLQFNVDCLKTLDIVKNMWYPVLNLRQWLPSVMSAPHAGRQGGPTVAENEILDPYDKRSAYRRQLLNNLLAGDPVESVAGQLGQILWSGAARVTKRGLVRDLLDAQSTGAVELRNRVRSSGGSMFAQVFEKQAALTDDPEEALRNTMQHEAQRYLDQLGLEVVPSESWPNLQGFLEFSKGVVKQLEELISTLARKLRERPDKAPRKPPVCREKREANRIALNRVSLLSTKQGPGR